MKVFETKLPGVLLIEPPVFTDDRGFFLETWRDERYPDMGPFRQDCLSKSRKGTLRGMHLQRPRAQGKLVWVIEGEIFDVAADLETHEWVGHELSGKNHRQLWIPPGYAHGFCVLSDEALVAYKCTEVYDPDGEVTVRWDDPDLAIAWPVQDPILSDKDAHAPFLRP